MKHFAGLAFLKHWTISSLFLVSLSGFAQDIAIGTWRTHFSYNNAKIIEQTSDKLFCAAENGLFSVDLNDNSIRKLSKLDGLSDVGISAMRYDSDDNVLVIGYRSGLIDLIFDDRIETIRDIFNSNLEGDKSINDITSGSGRVYLATDLGVIVINTSRSEIVENYVQIGAGGNEISVEDISFSKDMLLIRSDEGIQSGSISSNLLDFNNWNRYPASDSYSNLTLVSEQYYATNGDTLLQLNGGNWENTQAILPTDATELFSVNGELLTSSNGIVYQLTSEGFQSIGSIGAFEVNDIVSSVGQLIIADSNLGLIHNKGNSLAPAGPISDDFSRLRIIENEAFGFHSPDPISYSGSVKKEGFSLFSEGVWTTEIIDDFHNISDVALFQNGLYFGSIGDGLYNQKSDQIIMDIPNSNAELDTIINSIKSRNKLWISSFDNVNPIHSMTRDGDWISYTASELPEDSYLSIDLTLFGNAWLGGVNGSITVIDEEQDEIDRITTSNGLPSSFIDIDLSVEDDAWIGTSKGPALFTNASFIGSLSAIRPSFESRVLFENETVNAVMTDGGNRIWFGTNRGLWVFDENTSEQVALFNESNSPIPSNIILDLVYNSENGEVFIYTNKGLVSFRSSSSVGERTHQDVSVFPNPVRPDYMGLVGIKGVAKNASIKVTDMNGNLVKEIDANGSTASWDLNDVTGTRVVTGVYFLFSSSSDGVETYVGKIAVIR
ncbi:MAG: hypothetical protein AB8B73_14020 [Ekhidna sp.]